MSILKKAVEAKSSGKNLRQFVEEETANMPGRAGGLSLLRQSNRGGADGSNAGRVGQRLQFPWTEEILDLLCRQQDPVPGAQNKWPSCLAWDVDGAFFVNISIYRVSESYMGYREEDGPDDAKVWRTCGQGGDPNAPKQFKGATDADAFINFCRWLGGRPIDIVDITNIMRTVRENTFRQKIWSYDVESQPAEDTMIYALEHWDDLSAEEQDAVAEVVAEAGGEMPEDSEGRPNPRGRRSGR